MGFEDLDDSHVSVLMVSLMDVLWFFSIMRICFRKYTLKYLGMVGHHGSNLLYIDSLEKVL